MVQVAALKSADSPRVSILIPSYNYARYLPGALDSVRSQSFDDWQAVIVDDGSSDASLNIARDYATSDSRFHVLCHPDGKNHGLAASLRLALRNASAPLVAFLESDDAWRGDTLETRLNFWNRHADPAMLFDLPIIVQEGTRSLGYYYRLMKVLERVQARRSPPSVSARELLAVNLVPSFSGVLARRDLLEACSFDSPVPPLLDKWLWQQIAFSGPCLFLCRTNFFWRFHDNSYMSAAPQENNASGTNEFRTRTRQLLLPRCFKEKRLGLVPALMFSSLHSIMVRAFLKFRAEGLKGIGRAALRRFHGK